MKKFLAILLSCIMLLACIPLTASAENWSATETIADARTASGTINVTGTYTYNSTLTIAEGCTFVIENGGSIIFTGANGKLVNNGTIVVKRGGTLNLAGTGTGTSNDTLSNNATGSITLENGSNCSLAKTSTAVNYGTINNIDRMDIKGVLSHNVSIPGDFTESYSYLETWNRENLNVKFSVSYFVYEASDDDLDYTNPSNYTACLDAGKELLVPHGQKLFVLISPDESTGSWVDVGRMKLTVGGQSLSAQEKIDNDRGVFCVIPSNALDIGVYSTAYKDIVKVFEIALPSTEGYYVISKDGDVDVANVEYGKKFSFRVVLSPDYDKSDYYAYVNAYYMDRDEYDYYDITGPITDDGMATAGGVQQDIEIQIMGIQANERLEMVNSLVGFIQQIFEVIKEIFSYFTGIFEGLGSLGETV